jgi:phosphoheptose isomerase
MSMSEFNEQIDLMAKAFSDLRETDAFQKLYGFTKDMLDGALRGGKIILMGNGGSAADACHIVGELRGRFLLNRRSFMAISLSDSVATTTAIANDFGYEELFSHQIKGLLQENDSIIALSTSGSSKNILNGIRAAKNKLPDVNSLYITGATDLEIESFTHHIQIPIKYSKFTVARIQEMTMFLLHTMCWTFDDFFLDKMINRTRNDINS